MRRAYLITDKKIHKNDFLDSRNNLTVKIERAHQKAHLSK